MKHRITTRQIDENHFLIIETGTIEVDGRPEFTRERLLREDAAAVLVHHLDDDTIILTRQFRFAVDHRVDEYLLELPAGKLEKDEAPENCAVRETEEECGFRIDRSKLKKIASFFASPGYTTEKYFIFYAPVSESDRVSEGGGLETENEFIETIRMPRKEFLQLFESGLIEDAKTWAAASWLSQKEN